MGLDFHDYLVEDVAVFWVDLEELAEVGDAFSVHLDVGYLLGIEEVVRWEELGQLAMGIAGVILAEECLALPLTI